MTWHQPDFFSGYGGDATAFVVEPGQCNRFARNSDPQTSRKAATKENRIRWGSQCFKLLEAYIGADLIDEEAARVSGVLAYARSWWRRCSDLRQQGLIEPTGEERMSSAGSPQMVCRITDQRRALVAR